MSSPSRFQPAPQSRLSVVAVLAAFAFLAVMSAPVPAEEVDPAVAALFDAARTGKLQPLQAANLDPQALARFGPGEKTLLYVAAESGQAEVVRWLLDRKADPNLGTAVNTSPLGPAAYYGHAAIIKLLLERGADPNRANANSGWTPLMAAAQEERVQAGMLLVAAGANPNARDNDGATPLSIAVSRPANVELVRAMLARGGDPTSQDRYGYSVEFRSSGEAMKQLIAAAIAEKRANPYAGLSPDERYKLADAHFKRGAEAAWAENRSSEALRELSEALAIMPDIPIMLMVRAMVYKSLDDERGREDVLRVEEIIKSTYSGRAYDLNAGMLYFLVAVGEFRAKNMFFAKTTAELAIEHASKAGDASTVQQAQTIRDIAARIEEEREARLKQPFRLDGSAPAPRATIEDWSAVSEAIKAMIDLNMRRGQ